MSYSKLIDWRLQLCVLIVSCIAELIGILKFNIGIGTVVFLPLLYAFLCTLCFNPNIVPCMQKIIGREANRIAPQWILICLMPFIAKFAVGIGPKIHAIIQAGPALILQELGNVGTVLFALPIAVLLFGMGRESIGATHSIAREPNIALIADRFGLKSPEGMGVMGVYVMGTLFGAIYFSLMASVIASWNLFDVRALAMACGVGSGSMMGACSTTLAEVFPESKADIVAFAASSNLLTYATGLFVCVFIALPLAQWLYRFLSYRQPQAHTKQTPDFEFQSEEEIQLTIPQQFIGLLFILLPLLMVNWVSTQTSPSEAFIGLLILIACSMGGILIKKLIPLAVPSVAWVSILSILLTLPFMPTSGYVLEATNQVGLLAIITPALAYAGLAISKSEIALFKRSGFKIAIIALLTFTGTFVGSAVIAQALL